MYSCRSRYDIMSESRVMAHFLVKHLSFVHSSVVVAICTWCVLSCAVLALSRALGSL